MVISFPQRVEHRYFSTIGVLRVYVRELFSFYLLISYPSVRCIWTSAFLLCEYDASLPSKRPRHSSLLGCKYWYGCLFMLLSRARFCLRSSFFFGVRMLTERITGHTAEDRCAANEISQRQCVCWHTHTHTHIRYAYVSAVKHPLGCRYSMFDITNNLCILFIAFRRTHRATVRLNGPKTWQYIICLICHIAVALNLAIDSLTFSSSIKLFAFFIRQIT